MLKTIKNIFCSKEFLSTLSTGVICALISWGITYCIENKNREINLRPFLEIGASRVSYNDGHFGLVIRNTGKGPAIITGGYIKADSKIYLKDIDYNIWDTFLPELKIYSETFNQIWDNSDVFREYFKKIGLNKGNACGLFFSFDYIPILESSIKDGEDLALISYPTQYINSNIVKSISYNIEKKYSDSDMYQKIYQGIYIECRSSFENMVRNGRLNIKLEYRSLNDDKYETEDKKIKFSF